MIKYICKKPVDHDGLKYINYCSIYKLYIIYTKLNLVEVNKHEKGY